TGGSPGTFDGNSTSTTGNTPSWKTAELPLWVRTTTQQPRAASIVPMFASRADALSDKKLRQKQRGRRGHWFDGSLFLRRDGFNRLQFCMAQREHMIAAVLRKNCNFLGVVVTNCEGVSKYDL